MREPKIINTAADILERDRPTEQHIGTVSKPIPKIRPIGNRTLILRDEPVSKIGSILLPDRGQKAQVLGTVLAISQEDGNTKKLQHKEHDKVYFNDYAGFKHPEHEMLVVVRNEDIIGVVE